MKNDNAVALVNLAMIAMHTGHEDAAERSFRSALKLRPDIVEAHIGLGLIYSRTGRHVEMAEALREAIRIGSSVVRGWAKSSVAGKPEWLSFRPEYAHITGKMAEFLRQLDEADALVRLAAAHISTGQDEAAVEALEYCLKLAPSNEAAIVLLTVGYLLLVERDKAAAVRSGEHSMLRKIVPRLAKNLFER